MMESGKGNKIKDQKLTSSIAEVGSVVNNLRAGNENGQSLKSQC